LYLRFTPDSKRTDGRDATCDAMAALRSASVDTRSSAAPGELLELEVQP